MGIYIKGMEMPEPGEHMLSLQVYDDGTAIVIGNHRDYEKEPFEVIPVPEHGWLIDGRELYNDFRKLEAEAEHMWKLAKEHKDRYRLRKWKIILTERAAFCYDVGEAHAVIPADN